METNSTNLPASPLRSHAVGLIGMRGYGILLSAGTLALSFPFVPWSAPYWLFAVLAGAAGFPLLWYYWKQPRWWLFMGIIAFLIFSRAAAERICFPTADGSTFLFAVQYLSLYFLTQFSLVHFFRRRLLESLAGHPRDP